MADGIAGDMSLTSLVCCLLHVCGGWASSFVRGKIYQVIGSLTLFCGIAVATEIARVTGISGAVTSVIIFGKVPFFHGG